MSEPGNPGKPDQPDKPPLYVPDPGPSWIYTLGKVLLWFFAIAVGLTVLAFGTCLLMMVRW